MLGRRGRQCNRPDSAGVCDRFHALSLGSSVFSGIQRGGFGDHGWSGVPVVGCLTGSEAENLMQIFLANPRGFCAGVDRAIDIVERAVALFGAPIYVRHEVVHNKYVVDRLRTIGAVFVDELTEVPDGATVIFSAHGVPRVVQQEAQAPHAERFRCHLSAGHQSAHGDHPLCARGARGVPDRPRRASGGRGHHRAIRLDPRRLDLSDSDGRGCRTGGGAQPRAPGIRDADDALGR